MLEAEALATAVVAVTPNTAAPTQIILLRCKVMFLSNRSTFKSRVGGAASTAVHAWSQHVAGTELTCY